MKKNYWTNESDLNFKLWKETRDDRYFMAAYPALQKLAKYWSDINHSRIGVTKEELNQDLLGHSVDIILNKWDPKYPLYPYLGTCFRNYIFSHRIDLLKKDKKISESLCKEMEASSMIYTDLLYDERRNKLKITLTNYPFREFNEEGIRKINIILNFFNNLPSLHTDTKNKEINNLIDLQLAAYGLSISKKEKKELKRALKWQWI